MNKSNTNMGNNIFASRNSGFRTVDRIWLAALRFDDVCRGLRAEDGGKGAPAGGGRSYRSYSSGILADHQWSCL